MHFLTEAVKATDLNFCHISSFPQDTFTRKRLDHTKHSPTGEILCFFNWNGESNRSQASAHQPKPPSLHGDRNTALGVGFVHHGSYLPHCLSILCNCCCRWGVRVIARDVHGQRIDKHFRQVRTWMVVKILTLSTDQTIGVAMQVGEGREKRGGGGWWRYVFKLVNFTRKYNRTKNKTTATSSKWTTTGTALADKIRSVAQTTTHRTSNNKNDNWPINMEWWSPRTLTHVTCISLVFIKHSELAFKLKRVL